MSTAEDRAGEARLIARALTGDAHAERALYDAHVDRVYRLCCRLADGDPDVAQDYTQETFIRAFTRLQQFRGGSAFSTWLHSVALSVAYGSRRKAKRRRDRELAAGAEVPASRSAVPRDLSLGARLHAAIATLPKSYRSVLLLYAVEGYTHPEIAALLDVPVGTSKARLSRARAQLRVQLAGVV
jgi:RNA polymerase sigma-70 factor, ECF subfamily